jgi:hypothetical protein
LKLAAVLAAHGGYAASLLFKLTAQAARFAQAAHGGFCAA